MKDVTTWKDPTALSGGPPHPSGAVELGDDDMQQVAAGTTWACATVGLTVTVCSPSGTLCGSCQMGTHGCC